MTTAVRKTTKTTNTSTSMAKTKATPKKQGESRIKRKADALVDERTMNTTTTSTTTPTKTATTVKRRKRGTVSCPAAFRDGEVRRVLAFDIGMRNMALAVVAYHPVSNVYAVEHWSNVDILQHNGSTARQSRKVPVETIVRYLRNFLIESVDVLTQHRLDAVVAEMQQVGPAAAKVLGHQIIQFFDLFYRWCMPPETPMPEIRLQTGAQKLHVAVSRPPGGIALIPPLKYLPRSVLAAHAAYPKSPPSLHEMRQSGIVPVGQGATEKKQSTSLQRYRENKEYAVWQVNTLMGHADPAVFVRCPYKHSDKKDDYADALLHALFFLHNGDTRMRPSNKTVTFCVSPSLLLLPSQTTAPDYQFSATNDSKQQSTAQLRPVDPLETNSSFFKTVNRINKRNNKTDRVDDGKKTESSTSTTTDSEPIDSDSDNDSAMDSGSETPGSESDSESENESDRDSESESNSASESESDSSDEDSFSEYESTSASE